MAVFLADMDKKRIAKHAIFWFVWISSFTMVQSFGYGIHDYFAWLFYYLITLPLFMAHTYFIAYWVVPKYFFYHRYFIFAVWIVVLLILASVVELMISNEFVWRLVKPENIQQGNFLDWQNVLINGIGNEYIIIVFLSVKVIRFWNSKVGEKAELINQKLSTEIELLQYQSYPRFVLNVMDRLENLSETNSSQTSEMIVKLSNLMSNMTTGRKSTKIVLQKEVGLIRSYIEIQQMSFPKGFHVNFLVTGELNGLEIPPFLFFQLVEEGFLVLDDFSEKTDFTVLIKTEPHYLLFSLTLWNDKTMKRAFNPVVLENCRKYLTYFYSENHKVMSSFEINFVEITIEIYL